MAQVLSEYEVLLLLPVPRVTKPCTTRGYPGKWQASVKPLVSTSPETIRETEQAEIDSSNIVLAIIGDMPRCRPPHK